MSTLDSLSYRELQKECKRRGLKASGKRTNLEARLKGDGYGVQSPVESPAPTQSGAQPPAESPAMPESSLVSPHKPTSSGKRDRAQGDQIELPSQANTPLKRRRGSAAPATPTANAAASTSTATPSSARQRASARALGRHSRCPGSASPRRKAGYVPNFDKAHEVGFAAMKSIDAREGEESRAGTGGGAQNAAAPSLAKQGADAKRRAARPASSNGSTKGTKSKSHRGTPSSASTRRPSSSTSSSASSATASASKASHRSKTTVPKPFVLGVKRFQGVKWQSMSALPLKKKKGAKANDAKKPRGHGTHASTKTKPITVMGSSENHKRGPNRDTTHHSKSQSGMRKKKPRPRDIMFSGRTPPARRRSASNTSVA